MRTVILIAHNIRSTHNVGSLLRTADGLGVEHVYLTGYTPYPRIKKDARLPHIAQKIDSQIAKVSLGAEKFVKWSHEPDLILILKRLTSKGYLVAALEQSSRSTSLDGYTAQAKTALIVGEEVNGLDEEILNLCKVVLEIPMHGKKESFNVAVAAAIGLFQLTR